MVDRPNALEALHVLAELVRKEYNLSEHELQHALFSPLIPATIFSKDSTPLEAAISYLAASGQQPRAIAKLVNRTTSYITTIIRRGKKHREPTTTTHTIPATILANGAAGETITTYLAASGLSNKEIGALLHKHESTVRTWRRRAEEKR